MSDPISLNLGFTVVNFVIDNVFLDIGIIIVFASLFAIIAKLLKQPLIPAYVLAGLVLGPIFHIIRDQTIITTLSEIGIAFLLFIVGLEIDLKKLKSVALVSTIGGLTKSLVIFTLGFLIVLFAGFKYIEAAYLGIILAFSSTMVVIKILSDRRELDTLHSRIIIGFLLVEDILAIIVISIFGGLENSGSGGLFISLFKAGILIVFAVISSKYIFPKVFKLSAKSPELLFLSAVSTLFLFSLFFAGLGFSISIGAFVAGVVLANLPYSIEIIGRVKSMRDFFSTIFFVSLGISIAPIPKSHVILTLILLGVVWFVKPVVTLFVTAFFGYRKRPSFLTAISLAQASEFSLIIALQGLALGQISQEVFSITAIIVILTMAVTSYVVKYEFGIYNSFRKWLNKFDMFSNGEEFEFAKKNNKYDVLLVGYDRMGYSIVKQLHIMKKKLLIVDFNPEIIRRLIKEGIHCIYGDIGDPEILERINIKKLAMVISTSPDKSDNLYMMKKTKKANKTAMVFLTAYNVEDALELYNEGADYVILPHLLGGDHASLLIERFGNDVDKLIEHKLGHIEELKKRRHLGHDTAKHHRRHHHA